jgi:hypothetical protein
MDHLLIQPKTFAVCPRGHVLQAPKHPAAQFQNADGTVSTVVLCGRCQFEFFATTFPAFILPPETTREEADEKAAEMKAASEAMMQQMMTGEPPSAPEKAS